MYNPVISCFFFLVYNCMSRLSFFLLLPPTKLWENFKLAFSCLPSPFSYTSVARDIRQNVSAPTQTYSRKPAHRSPPPTKQHQHYRLTFFCVIRFFTAKDRTFHSLLLPIIFCFKRKKGKGKKVVIFYVTLNST